MKMYNKHLLVLLAWLCSYAVLFAAPFQELTALRDNATFGYEQYQMPAPLRALLAITDVARYAPTQHPYQQCKKIANLLHRYDAPAGTMYVAREFAPDTYRCLDEMAQRLRVPTPLLFIANRGEHSANVSVCRLGIYHHGLVLGTSFLRRRTSLESQAVVAYRLAQIAGKDCEKKAIARVVFPAVFCLGGGAYCIYRLAQALSSPQDGHWQSIKDEVIYSLKSWGLWAGALGVTWLVSELAYAHLSRKYAQEADRAAVEAFGGDAQLYADCLQRAHNDQKMMVQRKRGIERTYLSYVTAKVDELVVAGVSSVVTSFLYEALANYQENHEKMTTSSPLHAWFAKTPSHDNRIAHVRSVGQLSVDKDTSDDGSNKSPNN